MDTALPQWLRDALPELAHVGHTLWAYAEGLRTKGLPAPGAFVSLALVAVVLWLLPWVLGHAQGLAVKLREALFVILVCVAYDLFIRPWVGALPATPPPHH